MVPKVLGQLEAIARWGQLKYMRRRRTVEVIESGRIRFHPHDCRDWVLKKYQTRVKKILQKTFSG